MRRKVGKATARKIYMSRYFFVFTQCCIHIFSTLSMSWASSYTGRTAVTEKSFTSATESMALGSGDTSGK